MPSCASSSVDLMVAMFCRLTLQICLIIALSFHIINLLEQSDLSLPCLLKLSVQIFRIFRAFYVVFFILHKTYLVIPHLNCIMQVVLTRDNKTGCLGKKK